MINQFLQVGGVTSLKDFYKKFPTEAHFDHYVKMKYGGGINAYQDGGEPVSSDYPDSQSFLAAHAAWEANQTIPQVDTGNYDYENGSVDENGYPVSVNPNAPVVAKNVVATPTATVVTAPAATKLNPYSGGSIVDFLGAQGKATDKASRKKLAESMGITGYTGTADQNVKLLKMLQSTPDLLDQYPDSTSGTKRGGKKVATQTPYTDADFAAYNQYQAAQNPYIMAPNTPASNNDPRRVDWSKFVPGHNPYASQDESGSNVPWGAVGAAGIGAGTAYGLYRMMGLHKPGTPPSIKPEFTPRGLIGDAKFNQSQKILFNTPRANQIVADMKLNGKYTADQLRELKSLGIKTEFIDNLRAGLNKATAEEAAKFLTAELPKAAPKTAQTASKVANAAAEVAQHPGILRDMWGAFRAAPMVKYAAKLGKFLPGRAYGGETDDLEMLHHNYLQNGGYYQDGGDPTAWHVGGYEIPSWLKTTAQVLDPTGISSYGDAGRAISNAWHNPSWGSVGTAALETLGALPIVGKVGKAAKVAKVLAEGEKVSKVAKATGALGKAYRFAEKGLTPVAAIDRFNPIGAAVAKGMERVVAKTPNKIARGALKLGSDFNQGRRFGKAIGAGYNSIDKYFGFTPQDGVAAPTMSGSGVPYDFSASPTQRYGGQQYAHGGYYGNVPQHGNPGTYADGYSGTSNGGQYFQIGGMFRDGMRDGSLVGLAGSIANMGDKMGMSGGITSPIKNMNDKSSNLKNDLTNYLSGAGTNLDAKAIQDIVSKYQGGGSFVPSYGDSAYALPKYDYGANYQDGGAPQEQPQGAPQQPQGQQQGAGIDPQQVMQEVAQLLQQGAQPDQIMQQLVQEGIPQDQAQQIIQQVMQQMQGQQGQQQAPPMQMYGGGYADGGMTRGTEMDVTPQQMEMLKKQGYKFDII
jgi:polyhydroxyalkanoate synthesis regulator phasin